MKDCIFCEPALQPEQTIQFSNDYCMYLQLQHNQKEEDEKRSKKYLQDVGAGSFQKEELMRASRSPLEGSGVIVPKQHRETVFELTEEEWEATYSLLHKVKEYLDEMFSPDGYNIGWNCGETGGQTIFHSHLHILPRYKNEPFAGKGIRYLLKGASQK
ncbi:HIT family protein [Alteribacillus sp. HJP-4]|uniref:HIT family protein n=1 Tax=Alteribacillus sp. HJP-4 TaxID=2775394 RepID=UPI0035CCF8B9